MKTNRVLVGVAAVAALALPGVVWAQGGASVMSVPYAPLNPVPFGPGALIGLALVLGAAAVLVLRFRPKLGSGWVRGGLIGLGVLAVLGGAALPPTARADDTPQPGSMSLGNPVLISLPVGGSVDTETITNDTGVTQVVGTPTVDNTPGTDAWHVTGGTCIDTPQLGANGTCTLTLSNGVPKA